MVLVLLLAALAHAREIDFAEAVGLALSQGPDARVLAATTDLARARADVIARTGDDLELAAEGRPGETTLTAGLPLALGGGPLARRRTAILERQAATREEAAQRVALAAEAGGAYLDAVRAREHARHAAEARGLAVQLRDAAAARLAAGEGSHAEVVLEQAQAAAALDDATRTETEASVATLRLATLLGLREPLTLAGWPDLPPAPEPAVDATPAVRSARAEVLAAEARQSVSTGLTTIHLAGGWTFGDVSGPVVGASVALPFTGQRAAERRAADADLARAHAEELRVTASLRVEIEAAREELTNADVSAKAWSIVGLDGALDAAARRRAAGETSLAAYVAERDLVLDALRGATDARWRQARARLALWALTGEVPVHSLAASAGDMPREQR